MAEALATKPEQSVASPRVRVRSLDELRGLIMVLMALDHASYFVAKAHSQEFWGAELPQYEGTVEFLTRWFTHFCAPGFFFLLGIGVVMFAASRGRAGWSSGHITRHLLIRGALLVLLQFVIENPGWEFGDLAALPGVAITRGGEVPGGGTAPTTYFGVLYALGGVLSLCSLLFRLPTALLVVLSVTLTALIQLVIVGSDPAAAGERASTLTRPLLVYGRSVLFFYLVHLYVYALMGFAFPRGASTAVMYVSWILGLAVLYPLCAWYGRFKEAKPLPSVWRLF